MRERVVINEVGLRDGLQNVVAEIATEDKLELLKALIAAGVRHFEPTSFVHPLVVPRMGDAAELTAGLPEDGDLHYTALVPNHKGYERAISAGYRTVALLLATTESFNQRNVRMSLAEALEMNAAILSRARADGIATRAYLTAALACPYEGRVAPGTCIELARQLFELGADQVGVADTIGGGHPLQLREVLVPLVAEFGAARLLVHLHDTRGLAQAMAWTACELGIRHFDASIGGLGGCPFAPGATGNVATEDLVYLLENAGLDTGISLDGLRAAVRVAENVTAQRLGGRIFTWAASQEAQGRVPSFQA